MSFESDDTQETDRSAQLILPLQVTGERATDATQYGYPAPSYPPQFMYNNAPSFPLSTHSYQHTHYPGTSQTSIILPPNQVAPRYTPIPAAPMANIPRQNHYGVVQPYSLMTTPTPTEGDGTVKTETGDVANLSEYFGNLKVSTDAVGKMKFTSVSAYTV